MRETATPCLAVPRILDGLESGSYTAPPPARPLDGAPSPLSSNLQGGVRLRSFIQAAKATFSCPVFLPGDAGYAEEVTGFNLIARRTPEIVIGATSAIDVAGAVRFAGDHGLSVSVIGGGHGATSVDSGLLVSTRRMSKVTIDPATGVATFGAGVTWRAVVEASMPHGLVPIAGSSSAVGAVGYLLGGGTSPLGRSHGYSADYVEAMTVVTGAGEVVTASRLKNPELFWALRGGKFGLGIVTDVTMRLVQLPRLYGGSLAFTEDHLDTVVRGWLDWTAIADERVTTSVATFSFPDLDGMPPPFRGQRITFLRFAYPGDATRGAELATPLRALAPALVDDINILSADQIDRIHNDPTTPATGWEAGAQLGPLDRRFADVWLEHVGAGKQPPLQFAELRQSGGRQRQEPPDGDAVFDRQAAFSLNLISLTPPLFADAATAASAILTQVRPWSTLFANINFIGNNPIAQPWSPEVLARLDAVRHVVDPNGIFAHSR